MADNDIIAQLPELTWRGLVAPPYELVTFEYENDLSARQVPYVDGDIHDFTGRRSFPMTARLFFLNTLGTKIAGRRLFPEYFEEWRENLDGEIGELKHPILGPLQARVKNFKGELRATTRAGVIIDVTWLESRTDPGEILFGATLFADPAVVAAQIDTNWTFKGRTYPRALLPDTSLLSFYLALRSLLFAANIAALRQLRKLQGILTEMVDTINALTDVSEWSTLDLLFEFDSLLVAQAAQVERAVRPTSREVVRYDTTLDEFATKKGNKLSEIMSLNLAALRSPIVTRGTTLTFYV